MQFSLEKGIYSAALGISGGGVSMIDNAPDWIGYSLIGAALLILTWGLKFNGRHLWQIRHKVAPFIAPQMPFPLVLRHLGHGSKWSLTKCDSDPSLWHREAERELLNHLSRGHLRARGMWRGMNGGDNALRDIERQEWTKLGYPSGPTIERATDFIQSLGAESGMYRFVEMDKAAIYEIWPRWSVWTRLRRRLFKSPLSLAERTGEIVQWRKHNQEKEPGDDYYWKEL